MSVPYQLAVIGAGPKAAALAAKVHVINRLGLGPVSLTVIEEVGPAAFWLGACGFTSGLEPLSTSPAKDVGFPYRSTYSFGEAGDAIDHAMLAFSWQQHLVDRGRYARWIDAGSPNVPHREYGNYIAWVFEHASEGVRLLDGRVSHISLSREDPRWRVDVARTSLPSVEAHGYDALVLTGPGSPRRLPHDPSVTERVFHCDTRRGDLDRLPEDEACDVAIVGGGESAIACALFILASRPLARITVYTAGLPMSRAESFLENRVYSDPDEVAWSEQPSATRRDFVRRSDRGVFAPQSLASVAYDDRCRFICGRVLRVSPDESEAGVQLEFVADQEVMAERHDYAVNCTGFDLLARLDELLAPDARIAVEQHAGSLRDRPPDMEVAIGRRLEIQGLRPLLHVPGLAAMTQGPGFANLSSLGLLADRILGNFDPIAIQDSQQEELVERCS